MTIYKNDVELSHSGIKGQKWGVRRFQNEDGTLTEEGKRRYGMKYSGLTDKQMRDAINYQRAKTTYTRMITKDASTKKEKLSSFISEGGGLISKAADTEKRIFSPGLNEKKTALEGEKNKYEQYLKRKDISNEDRAQAEQKLENTKVSLDNTKAQIFKYENDAAIAGKVGELSGKGSLGGKLADFATKKERLELESKAAQNIAELDQDQLEKLVNRMKLEEEYEAMFNPPKKNYMDTGREALQLIGSVLGIGLTALEVINLIKKSRDTAAHTDSTDTMLYSYDTLMHYGIKGQRKGFRRFQNEDGSLTEEGKRRYGYAYNGYDAQMRLEKAENKALKYAKGQIIKNAKYSEKGKTNKIKTDKIEAAESFVNSVVNELGKKGYKITETTRPEIVAAVNVGKTAITNIASVFTLPIVGFGMFGASKDVAPVNVKRHNIENKENVDWDNDEVYEKAEKSVKKEYGKSYVPNSEFAEESVSNRYYDMATDRRLSDKNKYYRQHKIKHSDDTLMHYGVKGQKHGVRRWQNEDGSLTPAGYDHYGVERERESRRIETEKQRTRDALAMQKMKGEYSRSRVASRENTKLSNYGRRVERRYDLADSAYARTQARKDAANDLKLQRQQFKLDQKMRKEAAKQDRKQQLEQAKQDLSVKKANQKATRENIFKYAIGAVSLAGTAYAGYSFIHNRNLDKAHMRNLETIAANGKQVLDQMKLGKDKEIELAKIAKDQELDKQRLINSGKDIEARSKDIEARGKEAEGRSKLISAQMAKDKQDEDFRVKWNKEAEDAAKEKAEREAKEAAEKAKKAAEEQAKRESDAAAAKAKKIAEEQQRDAKRQSRKTEKLRKREEEGTRMFEKAFSTEELNMSSFTEKERNIINSPAYADMLADEMEKTSITQNSKYSNQSFFGASDIERLLSDENVSPDMKNALKKIKLKS